MKEEKKKPRKVRRSSVSGRFVSKEETQRNPSETVTETVKRKTEGGK